MNYYALIPFAAFATNLFLWSYVFATREREPVSRAYLIFVAFAMGWELSDFFGWMHPSSEFGYAFLRLNCLFWMPGTFLYVHFLYLYVRRNRDFLYWLGLAAVVLLTPLGLGTRLIVAGAAQHAWGYSVVPGQLYFAAVVAVTLLPGIYTIVVTAWSLKKVTDPVMRVQLRLLLIGVCLTFFSAVTVNVLLVIVLKIKGIPSLGSFLVTLQSLFVFIAMVRYRLFSVGIAQAAYDLFSRIHDGVMIFDRHRRPAAVNQHAADFFGSSVAQLSLLNADKVFPGDYSFDREYQNWEFSVIVGSQNKTARLAQTTLLQGGETVGKLAVIHDITEEKRHAQALSLSERRFRDVSLSIGDWIWELDEQMRYTFASGKVKEILGYEPAELLGKTPYELMSPQEVQRVRPLLDAIWSSRKPISDFTNWQLTRSGRNVCLLTSGVVNSDSAGLFCGYRGVNKDITERMEAQQQREVLETRVRQSEASKMEAIGQLAGGIAHDFNNMLGGITSYAEVLLRKFAKQTPEIERYAGRIVQASMQASDLIGKLLAFARKGSYDLGPLMAHQAIEDALRLLEHTLDRNVNLVIDLSAKRFTIRGNPTQIQGAVLNLALNARDAMPGGGTLTVSTATVTLSRIPPGARGDVFAPGEYLRITISDTGTGMDEPTVGRLFEPFFTTKEAGKGTGLGLASVYGTVMNHKGLIDVASAQGIGTTFTLFLPLAGNAIVPQQLGSADVELQNGTGTLLLIDDEELVNESCAELLREIGYEVHSFTSSNAAIEFYRQYSARIDAVILDMIMPEMDGFQTFLELKGINPMVRVLIASGYATDDRIQRTIDAGARGLIRKPFRLQDMANALNRVMAEPGR